MSQNHADSLQAMCRFTGTNAPQIGAAQVPLTPWDPSQTALPPGDPAQGQIGLQRGVKSITRISQGIYAVVLDQALPPTGLGAELFDVVARSTTLFPTAPVAVACQQDPTDTTFTRKLLSFTDETLGALTNIFTCDFKMWRYPQA